MSPPADPGTMTFIDQWGPSPAHPPAWWDKATPSFQALPLGNHCPQICGFHSLALKKKKKEQKQHTALMCQRSKHTSGHELTPTNWVMG